MLWPARFTFLPSLRASTTLDYEALLAAHLSGSTDSAMWDFTQATDSGTLTVADLSGNGNTISQATTANKPAIVSDGLLFDDIDDYIGFTASTSIADATVVFRVAHDGSSSVGHMLTPNGISGGVLYQAGNATATVGTVSHRGVITPTRGDLEDSYDNSTTFGTVVVRHNFAWAGMFFGRAAGAMGGTIRRAVLIIDADMTDLSQAIADAEEWVRR